MTHNTDFHVLDVHFPKTLTTDDLANAATVALGEQHRPFTDHQRDARATLVSFIELVRMYGIRRPGA